jgi:hypothetical protein
VKQGDGRRGMKAAELNSFDAAKKRHGGGEAKSRWGRYGARGPRDILMG